MKVTVESRVAGTPFDKIPAGRIFVSALSAPETTQRWLKISDGLALVLAEDRLILGNLRDMGGLYRVLPEGTAVTIIT
jgi:hypothetical protein